MDKKRIIFSVDGTLVQTHREPLQEFLEQEAQGSGEYFKNHFPDILADYETRFSVYNKDQLLWHLNRYSKQKLTPRFLEDLFLFNAKVEPQPTEEIKATLEYLKKKKYELVILTNWFKTPQEEKLRALGIRQYFPEVYSGEDFLKPNPESYHLAMGKHSVKECYIVGNNYELDIKGAAYVGLEGIYLDPTDQHDYKGPKIKKISELTRYL